VDYVCVCSFGKLRSKSFKQRGERVGLELWMFFFGKLSRVYAARKVAILESSLYCNS
jgi:predicted DNA-binding ribbon-helix-helix protein